jgi:hypothetical protein
VVAVDGIADGFAPAVRAEGVDVFVLPDVDGLHESLGQVGDGAGGSGFYIAADYGGDEACQGGAEIAAGDVVAGEEVGQVFAEFFRGAGAGFFLGVVEAEVGMLGDARSATTAAIGESKGTQGHAVLFTERRHNCLLRIEFWDLLTGKAGPFVSLRVNRSPAATTAKQETPARCPSGDLRVNRRYKDGPKTETPRLVPGRSSQQGYHTMPIILVKLEIRGKQEKSKPAALEPKAAAPHEHVRHAPGIRAHIG